MQQKVEELYERGEYGRAMLIYEKELAPIGDKYAQYMIGYMYWTGAGVDEDLATAVAWLRLAAERANPEFVAARDQARRGLSATAAARSERTYVELRQQYSDAVILLRQIRADIEAMRVAAGPRMTGGGRLLMMIDPRTGSSSSTDDEDRRARKRVESSLRFLVRQLGHDELATSLDEVDIDALETLVRNHVATAVEP